MASIYAKSERYKYFLRILIDKYKIKCHFCGEQLDSFAFYRNISGKKQDDISVHHLDENRSNNNMENLEFAHRGCHMKYHRGVEKERRLEYIRKRYNIT